MAAVHFEGYVDARTYLEVLLSAAGKGRVATVRGESRSTAVVDLERFRRHLAAATPSRARVAVETDTWSIAIPGLPAGAEGATFEEAVTGMVGALRAYARHWQDHLLDAPNHRDTWGLVQLISLSDDDQLRDWLVGAPSDPAITVRGPRESGVRAADATRVTLRPVTRDDLEIFETEDLTPDAAGPPHWSGFHALAALKREFAENGLLGEEAGTLTVRVGDQVAGRASWFSSCLWGPRPASGCWTIAIALRPDHWARGIGAETYERLVTYLFDHTRAHRVQAFTDLDDHVEQRALEKAGFQREGALRQARWRGGRWHDQVLYGVVRSALPVTGRVAG
jgi:RimJ/RimL family protein N-acetyltransferase